MNFLTAALELLKNNASQFMMAVGLILILGSYTDYALGLKIIEGMNNVGGAIGAAILLTGFVGWLQMRRIELEYKKLDVEMRKARLQAGEAVEHDATVISSNGGDNSAEQ